MVWPPIAKAISHKAMVWPPIAKAISHKAMVWPPIAKAIIISSLGHLMVFSLFNFSFDQNRFKNQEAPLVFWGQILPKAALNFKDTKLTRGQEISPRLDNVLPKKPGPKLYSRMEYSLKPQVELAFNCEKSSFVPKDTGIIQPLPQKKDSPIMFHPLLPYQLQLYFKDRQAVHIELMFNIIARGKKNTILIQRKISSGNLEADLLSSRYINHYFFIQQARFPLNTWQTVKIDLSTKND